MSAKVLILDAAASSATAALQSLGRHSVEIHGVGRNRPLGFRSRRLSRGMLYPEGLNEVQLLDWIRELDDVEGYSLVIPATEIGLRIMQGLADGDDLRRRAVLPAVESVETGLDKMETWRVARRLEIPVPESRLFDGELDSSPPSPYPVVLKTLRSQVVRDGRLVYVAACIARNRAERAAFLEKWREYTGIQEQEFFPGRGVGVECLYERGRLRWAFGHQRLHELPLTGGASSYRQSIPVPPELLDCTRRLLDELDWHGVAMVEFRVNDDGGFVLLEVNPRLWGSLPLAVRAGVDFPLGLLRLATGGDPGPQPRYRLGYRMRNLERDLLWMWDNWSADHDDPLLLTRSRTRSIFEWFRVLTGREGWDHASWLDPGPLFVQVAAVVRRVTRAVRSLFSRTASSH